MFVAIGGRGTRGGVFRVRYMDSPRPRDEEQKLFRRILTADQPNASWSRSLWEPLTSAFKRADFESAAADLTRKALAKRDQPLVVLDLSVPRAVAPDVAGLDGVIVYDLDALLPVIEEHRAGRQAAAEEVTPILIGEVHKFLSLRTFAAFTPAIEELKSGFAEERELLLDRVTKGQATARELELAHAMERQLLHLALSQLKESARQTQSTAALERAYLRFVDGLPGDVS